MAAITSAQSGIWENPNTWVGGVVPGDGDTVTIASGHHIIVSNTETPTIVGTGSGDAVTITNNATLEINGGLGNGLFVKGNINMAAGSAGCTLRITGSRLMLLQGFRVYGNTNYPKRIYAQNAIIMAVDNNLNIATNPNNSGIGNNSYEYYIDFDNVQLLAMGNGTTSYALYLQSSSNSSAFFKMKKCLVRCFGALSIGDLSSASALWLHQENDFRGTEVRYGLKSTTENKIIEKCTYYNASVMSTSGDLTEFKQCVFVSVAVIASGSSRLRFSECGFFASNAFGVIYAGNCLLWHHTADPQGLSLPNGGGITSTIENCVFDGDGYYQMDNMDDGDCVLTGFGAIGNRNVCHISGNIVLGHYGTLLTVSTNYVECYVSHCTVYGKSYEDIKRVGSITIGETNGTDQHVFVSDCLFVDTNAGIRNFSAYQANSLEYCDYIAHYGLYAPRVPGGTGDSPLEYVPSRPYRTVEPVDASYGTVAGWGLNDKPNVDPNFKDATRRVASYLGVNQEPGMVEGSDTMSENPGYIVGLRCLYRNGRDENGNPVTWDNRYTPLQILNWIRDGFRPRNTALKGVASDGGDIGAMPVEILVYPQGFTPKVVVIG